METEFDLPEREIDSAQPDSVVEIDEGSASPEEISEGDEEAEGSESLEDLSEGEEQAEGERRPTIFISYNRNPNDSGVAVRIYEELSQHYRVFLDQRTLIPASDWELETELWLKKADFIIALISATSVETLFMKAELQDAYERYRTEGRPRVIPVQIAYAGPYGLRLRAYIGHFQALPWDSQNYLWLFEQLRAAISNKPAAISKSPIVGTDIIPISDALRMRWANTFVEPPELSGAGVLFEEKRLLWVTGDAGVRNYIALSLAARAKAESMYEVTRSRKWSEINNTNISDSVIVLRDALPAIHLDTEAAAVGEWHSLRAIIERNNIIIATSPDDEFERLIQELRRYQFTDYQHLRIESDSYTDVAKIEIFARLLEHLFQSGEIDEKKYTWAAELLRQPDEATPAPAPPGGRGRVKALERLQRESRSKFRENIRVWSPSDIERFALSLPRVNSLSDIAKLLQRNAAIEDEIHSWFLALDDSTRCFVLALAIFPETNNEKLWEKYKVIVDDLRRFDPGLRLMPFGVCRERADPYVLAEGPIYLTDERVSEAIRQELARSYREYFVELLPRLKEWSVPPGHDAKTLEQKNERKPKIEESREMRAAIARAVGIVGRLGVDDLLEILDYWATDSNIHIRKAVAIALEQTAKSQTGVNHALNLLEKWCLDVNLPGALRWRPLAAAIALGSVTSAAPDPYVTLRALHCLGRLARSRRKDARFYVSIALRQVARHSPLAALEGILRRLAADERIEVRINVAGALNDARSYDAEAAAALSEQWALSDDENRRWVALAGVVTSRGGQNGAYPDKYQKLLELLENEESAASLASVLGETVKDDHHGPVAEETFMHLAQEAKGGAWDHLAKGLADVPLGKLENRLLPLLRSEATPLLDERVIDVRREVLKKRLSQPARLLNTLKAWLNQEEARIEVFRTLTLLFDEGEGGCRSRFVTALAEYYAEDRLIVNQLLARLENLAPAYFASFARAVRQEAFKHLLLDPPNFVASAYSDLASDETSDAARDTLESLALDRPTGSRDELLGALAQGYAHTPATVKTLLLSMKSSGRPELVRAAYEFNYRAMEGAISAPHALPSVALEMINGDDERGEALSMLNYMASPEPQGRRSALVQALVEARLREAPGVDELLAHPALKNWARLATLQSEVTRGFYVRKIFSRKFTRLFTRK